MSIRLSIALLLLAGAVFQAPTAHAIAVVRMETAAFGNIDLLLRDDYAPITVNNFLQYINSGAFHNTFVSRSVPGFVVQGGGYAWSDTTQATVQFAPLPPITNEFYFNNTRGTIAMALLSGQPASATNEWFINLADNSGSLDPQSFTVFGSVLGTGMDVINAIALLPVQDISTLPTADTSALSPQAAFTHLPLYNYTSGPIGKQNLALITDIQVLGYAPGSGYIAKGTSGNYSILTHSSAVLLDHFSVADNPSPSDVPAGATFSEGFFNISLWHIVPSGSATQVLLTLPAGDHPNAYYKYGKTPDEPTTDHWYNFTYDKQTHTGAVFNGNKVALFFVDGQRGDDDLTADGVIGDVGGPAVVPSSSGGGAVDGLSLLVGLLAMARRRRVQKSE